MQELTPRVQKDQEDDFTRVKTRADGLDIAASVLIRMEEENTVEGALTLVAKEAQETGAHRLMQGEWDSVEDWLLSKLDPANEISAGLRSELNAILHVVLPTFRMAGISDDELNRLVGSKSKVRKIVPHMRTLKARLEEENDQVAAREAKVLFDLVTDDRVSVKDLERTLDPEPEVPPVQVERAWTGEQSAVYVIRADRWVQIRAIDMLLRKLPNNMKDTVDIIAMANSLLQNV